MVPEFLDSFEDEVATQYRDSSTVPYVRMQQLVKLLRLVQEDNPNRLSMMMQARLGFTAVRWARAAIVR